MAISPYAATTPLLPNARPAAPFGKADDVEVEDGVDDSVPVPVGLPVLVVNFKVPVPVGEGEPVLVPDGIELPEGGDDGLELVPPLAGRPCDVMTDHEDFELLEASPVWE